VQKQLGKLDVGERPLAEIEPLRFAEVVQSTILNHMQFLANVAGASLNVAFPKPKEGDIGVVAIQLAQYAKDGASAELSPLELLRILAISLYSVAGKAPLDERDMDHAVSHARNDRKVWTTVIEAALARWCVSRGEGITDRQLAALVSTSDGEVAASIASGEVEASRSPDGELAISAEEAMKLIERKQVSGFDGKRRRASTAADLANNIHR
jgi:hypothetical protein